MEGIDRELFYIGTKTALLAMAESCNCMDDQLLRLRRSARKMTHFAVNEDEGTDLEFLIEDLKEARAFIQQAHKKLSNAAKYIED